MKSYFVWFLLVLTLHFAKIIFVATEIDIDGDLV